MVYLSSVFASVLQSVSCCVSGNQKFFVSNGTSLHAAEKHQAAMLFYSVRLGDQNVVGQRHSTQLRLGKSRRAKNFVSNPTFGRSWFLGKKCKRTDPKVFVRLPTTLMISFNRKMRPQKFCKSFPAKSITITYSQLKSIWLSNLVSKLWPIL